jgi:hypothetical protein
MGACRDLFFGPGDVVTVIWKMLGFLRWLEMSIFKGVGDLKSGLG